MLCWTIGGLQIKKVESHCTAFDFTNANSADSFSELLKGNS